MEKKTCRNCIGDKYCSTHEKYDLEYINSLSDEEDVSTLCPYFTDTMEFVSRAEVERAKQEVAKEILALVWEAYNTTNYGAEFEERLDKIEKKYIGE